MYCIYTDTEVSEEKGNWDHVVPLSLGGADQFVVWSDRDHNSMLGSVVDGALHKDPLMQFALRDAGVVGHGGKTVEPRWRNVTIEDRPAQVTLGKEKVTVWDARDRRELSLAEVAGKPMNTQLHLNIYTALRFVAKVALGGGHFIYGDEFRRIANCNSLRSLVMLDVERAKQDEALKSSGITICDRFHEDGQPGGSAYLYRVLCEAAKRSIVISVPHKDAIAFHVGIVGMYIGSIVIPADTKNLPWDGDHELGHVIVLAPGTTERISFKELVSDFWRAATGEEPPQRPL